jgi:DNA-binding NarL/FixJ family response regulator
MKEFLSSQQRSELLKSHRIERDGKIRDRIKSVLLSDDGWTYKAIARVLFLDQETVSSHVTDYKSRNKLKSNSGGSQSKLTAIETEILINHIESNLYLDANMIRSYIALSYDVKFSHSGMSLGCTRINFPIKD